MNVFNAIQSDDVEQVRALVAEDPQVGKQRGPDGVTALLTALYFGRTAIAEELVRPAPALDVFEAAAYGDTAQLRRLVDDDPSLANAWSPDGFQPLGLAVFFGHLDAARLLLDRGADVNAVQEGGFTPLHAAAQHGDAELARLLLEHGANRDAATDDGRTAATIAAEQGHDDVVELLRD